MVDLCLREYVMFTFFWPTNEKHRSSPLKTLILSCDGQMRGFWGWAVHISISAPGMLIKVPVKAWLPALDS